MTTRSLDGKRSLSYADCYTTRLIGGSPSAPPREGTCLTGGWRRVQRKDGGADAGVTRLERDRRPQTSLCLGALGKLVRLCILMCVLLAPPLLRHGVHLISSPLQSAPGLVTLLTSDLRGFGVQRAGQPASQRREEPWSPTGAGDLEGVQQQHRCKDKDKGLAADSATNRRTYI